MSYHNGVFIKEKGGVIAPKGFHYMPNGKLMSDADHIAVHGYIEKKITNFNIDTKDINHLGETRSFSIRGDRGAVFSLEIYDDATTSNYYNFSTGTWSTTKSGLYNVESAGNYQFSITFPVLGFIDATCEYNNDPTIAHDDDDGAIEAGMSVTGNGIPDGSFVKSVTSDTSFELGDALGGSDVSTTGGAVTNGALRFSKLKTYTVDLHAKTVDNIKTKHTTYSEVKNPDNTININKSTGSNSDLLRRIIYQDVRKNLYLSLIAPALTGASTDVVDGTRTNNRIELDNIATTLSNMALGDKVTTQDSSNIVTASHVLITKINPDNDNTKEIEVNQSVSPADDEVIVVTPAFAGMTPNGVVSTTGQQAFEISSGGSLKKSFSITCTALAGRTLSVSRLPTVNDLCAFTTVTFAAAALAIPGEDTDSAAKFFRWPITNIAKLQEGMVLDPARRGTGINTTTPATISKYLSTITSTEIVERKYYTDIESTTINDVSVDGVDDYGNDVTAIDRNGVATAQIGNITFNVQQADALKADADVRIFAYGANQIKSLTGVDVAINNVVITPTQVSTTTSAASSASTTIGLDEVANISAGMTIRGVGIDTSTAIPTVVIKAAASGAANITASAAQTIEDNQTLYFDGASNILTITGTIEISNMSISDTTLYFDVEKFINAS